MKFAIFGLVAFAAVAQSAILPLTHLVRTPSLDSAVIQSARTNGAFSYSTVENHAYSPAVVQSVTKLFYFILVFEINEKEI
jgi:hypothetical protein